ncbi:MAG: amidohydrolase family protein [Thermoanaerobaculia bacterium]|nr:amidohydrolase family protein [Thermoanaerobaculia bacterium]
MRTLTDRIVPLVLAAGLAAGSPLAAHDQIPGAVQDRPILLRGGTLYTVSDGILEDTDLLFEEGKITAIGKDLSPPEDAEVIDVAGKNVYPGLIATISTLGLTEIGAVRATHDQAEVGEVTPEVAAHVAWNPDSELIPTVRNHGITTAQIVPLGSLIRGRSFVTHLDGWTKEDAGLALEEGLFLEWPRAAVSTAWWVRSSPEEQKKRMQERRDRLEDAFDEAEAYRKAKEANADLPVDLRWEAMLPVLAGEKPLYVDADDYRQMVEAVAFAEARGLDLVITGARDAHMLADFLAEHEVPVILGTVQSRPMRQGDGYDTPFRTPAVLHEAGVTFALSRPGSWRGRDLPFQAGQAMAFGLPEEAAIRAMTLTPARLLGIDDREGSLEVGKDATLFVSTGDVTDALTQDVIRVWIRGRPVDLDDKQRELYRKYEEKLERRAD